jgi:hypothetical protein
LPERLDARAANDIPTKRMPREVRPASLILVGAGILAVNTDPS